MIECGMDPERERRAHQDIEREHHPPGISNNERNRLRVQRRKQQGKCWRCGADAGGFVLCARHREAAKNYNREARKNNLRALP